jgi:DNA-binding LacI/PurR family transcriptional regulator
MAERFAGYREALEAAAIEIDPELFSHRCHDVHDAQATAAAMLAGDAPPTASGWATSAPSCCCGAWMAGQASPRTSRC